MLSTLLISIILFELIQGKNKSNTKHDSDDTGKIGDKLYHFWLFISFNKIANPRIDGTQSPINMPDSFSPLNHRYSEKTSDKNAAASIRKSEGVNFLNIFLNGFH